MVVAEEGRNNGWQELTRGMDLLNQCRGRGEPFIGAYWIACVTDAFRSVLLTSKG
jgi:hypothetical protein